MFKCLLQLCSPDGNSARGKTELRHDVNMLSGVVNRELMPLNQTDVRLLLQLTQRRQSLLSELSLDESEAELRARLMRLKNCGIVSLTADEKRASIADGSDRVIGVDMGATNTRYLVSDLGGNVLSTFRERARPLQDPKTTVDQLIFRISELNEQHCGADRLRAIAIGVPSAVHPQTGLLISANNLEGWKDVSMREDLAAAFSVPVLLDNDCNMAAIGEYWRGSAVGVANFIFLAIGTGIGSGIFIDHKLYQGRTGSAGEVYLMNVDWRRWNEEFPETGHVETYVSGVGIAEQARQAGILKRSAKMTELDDRDSRRVFAAMRRGNPKAAQVVNEVLTVLGVTVANMISVLDPDLVVLNGGITKGDPHLLLGTVHKVVHRIHRDVPAIRISALGDKAQLYGSLWTGLQHVFTTMAAG
jgi:glucokinase